MQSVAASRAASVATTSMTASQNRASIGMPSSKFHWLAATHPPERVTRRISCTALGASDLGQSGNPIHPDGYKKLVAGLKKEGISQADIDKMMKTNPAKLLGLE